MTTLLFYSRAYELLLLIIAEVYENIRSYDPFVNISNRKYPNLLVTASTIDIRVPYWGPLKWTIKMREMKSDKNLLLMKVHWLELVR
jgi:protease II